MHAHTIIRFFFFVASSWQEKYFLRKNKRRKEEEKILPHACNCKAMIFIKASPTISLLWSVYYTLLLLLLFSLALLDLEFLEGIQRWDTERERESAEDMHTCALKEKRTSWLCFVQAWAMCHVMHPMATFACYVSLFLAG